MGRFTFLLCVLLACPSAGFAQNFALSLDANSASGDQSVLSANTSANQSVSIQVFGTGLTDAKAVNLRFEFDASQVTYGSFTAGNALPSAQALPTQGTGFVEVGIASFGGGRATASRGMLGTIQFRTTAGFSGASIRLVRGELVRGLGNQSIVIMPNLTLSLSAGLSPDFDGNGEVDFKDFVLFAGAFGARRGDNRFEARFDLDSSGDIGFGDFVEFAGAFGRRSGNGGGGGVSGSGGSGGGGGVGGAVDVRSPDLIVESPSVSANTLTPGQSFTLNATVRNAGNAESAGTTLRYYQSSDASISTTDTSVGEDAVSRLSASAMSAESIRVTASSNAGTYYYGACVASVSGESNTNNNCSDAVRVTVTPPAGKIYFTTTTATDKIFRANLDGSNYEELIDFVGGGPLYDIAIDTRRDKIYWAGGGYVSRANLDGSNIERLIYISAGYTAVAPYQYPLALDVDRGKIYYCNATRGSFGHFISIHRANLDGSNMQSLGHENHPPKDFALDVVRGKIYWTGMTLLEGKKGVWRANLDGSVIEHILVSGSAYGIDGIGVDVGRGKIYYWEDGDYRRMRRANLDGSNAEVFVDAGAGRRIVGHDFNWDVNGGKMYWVSHLNIHRANLDGSNVESIVIPGINVRNIALDLRGQ